MVDRHDRQVLARHLRDQAAPEAGADDDVGRLDDSAAVVWTPLMRPFSISSDGTGRVGERLQLAGRLGLVDELARRRPASAG
jgi:hypothetical protein